jgi:hypothetical protein
VKQIRTSVFVSALLATLLTIIVMSACGHGKTACQVVQAAQESCAVIKYMGPDGKEQSVQVTPEELAAFGARVQAARKAKAP